LTAVKFSRILKYDGFADVDGGGVMFEDLDLVGAVVTLLIFVFSILVFGFRLRGSMGLAKWAGGLCLAMGFPLMYLLWTAPQMDRTVLYFVQIGLMLLWMLVTLLADYIYNFQFRENIRLVIGYVVLFFAGAGGMLGVSALAGQPWITINGILFLVMAVLAFVQRAKTGY
jgi:hypothetical protein